MQEAIGASSEFALMMGPLLTILLPSGHLLEALHFLELWHDRKIAEHLLFLCKSELTAVFFVLFWFFFLGVFPPKGD